jgi:uncharacterized protein (DUF2267 family)
MDYDRLIGLVQNRARLTATGDAVSAIRATLETLAERIGQDEARHLAAQLPREIAPIESDLRPITLLKGLFLVAVNTRCAFRFWQRPGNFAGGASAVHSHAIHKPHPMAGGAL